MSDETTGEPVISGGPEPMTFTVLIHPALAAMMEHCRAQRAGICKDLAKYRDVEKVLDIHTQAVTEEFKGEPPQMVINTLLLIIIFSEIERMDPRNPSQ